MIEFFVSLTTTQQIAIVLYAAIHLAAIIACCRQHRARRPHG